MQACTDFPDYCCRCLCPDPRGTWDVVMKSRKITNYPVYEETTVRFRVPMCRACRRGIHSRRWLAVLLAAVAGFGAMVAGAVAMRGYESFMIPAMAAGCFATGVAYFWLKNLFKVDTLKHIACCTPDFSWVQFGNPEYQKLYTGERRPRKEPDPAELRWR